MDIQFCEQCDMMLNYYTEEDDSQKLYLGCKACGFKVEDVKEKCIYNNDYEIDLSQIISRNKFLEHDITLPIIKDNQNITCPNKECESHKKGSEIIYIKYDTTNMKYAYICKECKQCWVN